MQPQEITIIIHSDIDPSQLLDIANEYGEQIAEEVKTYGEDALFDDAETSVQTVDGLEVMGRMATHVLDATMVSVRPKRSAMARRRMSSSMSVTSTRQ